MMKRLLPTPLLSAALVAMWLVLNRSLAPAHWLLAIGLGLALPVLFAPLRPVVPRVRHPLALARLIAVVGHDVVASNFMVLRTILAGDRHPPQSGFVIIPMDLRDATGIAALAMITTAIPGTVWCEVARDGSSFMLHVWHAPDKAEFAANYKARYERPLIQIFES